MQDTTNEGVQSCKVLNKYKNGIPKDAVYVGRPTKWGNPFVVGVHGERGECVEKFREWVYTQPELIEAIKRDLKGKDLVCFCAPKSCHADVLIEIANS